jgi:hypothetical protein
VPTGWKSSRSSSPQSAVTLRPEIVLASWFVVSWAPASTIRPATSTYFSMWKTKSLLSRSGFLSNGSNAEFHTRFLSVSFVYSCISDCTESFASRAGLSSRTSLVSPPVRSRKSQATSTTRALTRLGSRRVTTQLGRRSLQAAPIAATARVPSSAVNASSRATGAAAWQRKTRPALALVYPAIPPTTSSTRDSLCTATLSHVVGISRPPSWRPRPCSP